MLKWLGFVGVLCVGAPSEASDNAVLGWRVFPSGVLMARGLAGVRTPGLVLSMRLDAQQGVSYRAQLGSRVGLLEYKQSQWAVQWFLEGGGWFDLHRTSLLFNLHSGDYLMGTGVAGRWKAWRSSLEFNHISAHLGDGLFEVRKPINYSREDVTLRVAYDHGWLGHKIRGYGYAGVLVRTRPQHLGRTFAALGAEWRGVAAFAWLQPACALETMWHADTHTVDVSARMGVFMWPSSLRGWDVFFGFTGYHGSDRRGQFVREKERFWGLGLYFLPAETLS
jgi:hypothetical protein